MTSDRLYITTPIYYVNDKPHIGHAYSTLAADVVARFNRLDGRRVMFLTGTDEHGQKVQKSALSKGVDPQTFTDRVSRKFRDLAVAMNFSIDDFIRTTEARHHAAAKAIWETMAQAGDIYEGSYDGWYSVRDEAFYDEKELEVKDGKKLAPTGAEVEWVSEPSYFFRLSAWADRLLAFYDENPDFILPASRRNEVISFVKGGLQDLSISRTTFDWGIQVPGDDRHIMYVWLDALTNYITAIGYPDQENEAFKAFWPADFHLVGKDILRFHAVYWPAFLMSAGLAPPKRIFAHGWLLNDGQKMSKSLGNVLDPYDLKEKYGLDQTRYFLLREVPFGNDGYIGHEALVRRINSDLANDLGNLAQRSLSMIAKNCGGAVPVPGAFTDADDKMMSDAASLEAILREHLQVPAFHKGLEAVWQVIGDANRYIDEQAPWALKKTDPERMGTVLYVIAESLRRIGILLQPVMPDSMAKLLDVLGVPEDRRRFADLETPLAGGADLPKPTPIFPRYVEEAAAE